MRVRRLEHQDDPDGETPGVSVDLAVEAVEADTPDRMWMEPVVGGARVTVVGVAPELRCGDRVDGVMRMRVPARYRDPGAWQYGDSLLEQGIGAQGTVGAGDLKTRRGVSGLRCDLYAVQAWASGRMRGYVASTANGRLPGAARMTEADAGMVDAMLFGDRAGLNHAMRVGFERTGSFHLFVVSGMHVALIAFGIFWLARRMRMPLWAATGTTIALTGGYAALTGFGVPVQRAFWMASLFLLARVLDRERSTLNALGVAVLGVLVWAPSCLFEASFQMTFLAILAVAGIAVPLGEGSFLPYARAARRLDEVWRDVGLAPRVAQFRVVLRMVGEPVARVLGQWARGWAAGVVRVGLWGFELGLVAVVIEAVMAVPMAVYFHRAAALGVPANVVSVPVVGASCASGAGDVCGEFDESLGGGFAGGGDCPAPAWGDVVCGAGGGDAAGGGTGCGAGVVGGGGCVGDRASLLLGGSAELGLGGDSASGCGVGGVAGEAGGGAGRDGGDGDRRRAGGFASGDGARGAVDAGRRGRAGGWAGTDSGGAADGVRRGRRGCGTVSLVAPDAAFGRGGTDA